MVPSVCGCSRPTKATPASAPQGSSIAASHTNGYGGDSGGSYLGDKIAEQQAKYQASLAKWIPPTALAHIGDETTKISPLAMSTRRVRSIRAEQRPEKRDHLVLAYQTTDGGRHVVLRGIDEHKDSLVVVLDRVDRKYALSESTLSAGEY